MAPSAVSGRESASVEAIARRLEELRAASAALIAGTRTSPQVPTIPHPESRLERAKVHEWIGVQPLGEEEAGKPRGAWSPPLAMLIEMAAGEVGGPQAGRDRVVWIGEKVWPFPAALVARGLGLERCLFVRAPRAADRLWAIDLALRARVAVVVADGSRLDLSATRRLQLAAEAGGGLCLLTRPAWERGELSAAATRWLVRDAACLSMNRRWTVELLRCKGLQPAPGGGAHVGRAWVVERDGATRSVRVVADVLDRFGEAPAG